MRRFSRILLLILLSSDLHAAAQPTWQYGRIVDVRKSVTSRTKAYVVNTPITEDVTVYTIWVHLQDKVLTGNYELSPGDSAPPQEWITKYPVKVQLQGDTMYLRAPTGDVRLHIIQRKAARAMLPLTAEEKKRLAEMENPEQSLIGFSESKSAGTAAKSTAAEPPPPPPAPPTGTVSVRSTPYLSEVFVDGDSMGYTPAKIALPPGKHNFRVEKSGYKPWTKEMTITVGSELTLDATLEKR
jgi:PEGA domain-containing protein